MDKLKSYWAIILIGIVVLGLAFYWYEWRPYKISKWCAKQQEQGYRYSKNWHRSYKACMREAGITR